ncbi:MAG: amino acid ABC transporter permease, partial [Gammaproteobacteria bacterium]|nr:amino acid ABC transporter permease [Gammaproteobacteria bacterium]
MIVRLWTDPRLRAWLWQILALAAVAWFLVAIVANTLTNLESRGITSGFSFLDSTAGFGVTMSLIPYTEASSLGRAFMVGLLNTLLVSAIGI